MTEKKWSDGDLEANRDSQRKENCSVRYFKLFIEKEISKTKKRFENLYVWRLQKEKKYFKAFNFHILATLKSI